MSLRTIYFVRVDENNIVTSRGNTDELAFNVMKNNEGVFLKEVEKDEYEIGDTYVDSEGD